MTTAAGLRVEAAAEKRFFIEMLTKDIELLPAIVDLVDNSVDGARSLHPDGDLRGQWVRIEYDADSFRIADNSGGIAVEVARHYAFRFGRAKDFTGVKRSVGQFGVGMKRAIFKIGGAFHVSSVAAPGGETNPSRFELDVDVETWAAQPEWAFTFKSADDNAVIASDETVGAAITITKLHDSVRDDLADIAIQQHLRAELRVRHQESIQNGLEIYLNGDQALRAARPALQASDVVKPVVRTFSIPAGDGVVEVRLYAGTIAPPNKGATNVDDDGQAERFQDPGDAGWYLFCNDRLLLVADRSLVTGWGSSAAAYHPQYRFFRGFVYLSADDAGLLPWNTTKTAVDRDSPVFRAVQSEMKKALVAVQAVINRAKQTRSRHDDPADKPDLLEALDDAQDQPLADLVPSDNMVAPESPPSKTSPTVQIQRIQYTVDPAQYKEVAEMLEAPSASDVGRRTFEYFYEQEIG